MLPQASLQKSLDSEKKFTKSEKNLLNLKILGRSSQFAWNHWVIYFITQKPSILESKCCSHQVQCDIPTFETLLRKYTHLFLERCRKSNNMWLRALMQSDCLYSSLFFEHYNRILLCVWVIELCSIRLIDGVPCHNAFAFLPTRRLDQFRNWRPTPQKCCNKCYRLANISVNSFFYGKCYRKYQVQTCRD